jgi:tetratricopeptide (TPR) repeat protein
MHSPEPEPGRTADLVACGVDWLARAVSAIAAAGWWRRPQSPVHRTIVVVDVAEFGDPRRTDPHQLQVRSGLYRVLRRAFNKAGIPWELCRREDRGDGVFLLASPYVAKTKFTGALPLALVEALTEHNRTHQPQERIRLRMALHAGEINYDDFGVTAAAINLAFRLVEAPALKAALEKSTGVLAVVASSWFYGEVIRHSPGSRPESYRPVTVRVKETMAEAWIRLPDSATFIPPPRPDPSVPRQLPCIPTLFVGRRHALSQLSAASVSAISGMGGVGKTWLALRWAQDNADRFPDGQLYVNLRGFDPSGEPTPVAAAVRGFLDALGVAPGAIPVDLDGMTALYRSLVATKRMLILLDNAANSAQVLPLLPGSATCAVLVTSRHQLNALIVGHGAKPVELDVLDDEEAYELLAGRIGADRMAAEPAAVAQLLQQCAGLPLALGIVAAYAETHEVFRLGALVTELDHGSERLDMLSCGDLPANLRAAMSWSYHALTADSAGVFRLLGLIPGPSIGALGAAALTRSPNARELLRDLANAHLVQQYAPGRYRMHDLIRIYAAECARHDSPAADNIAAVHRLVSFYLCAANAGERILYPHRQPISIGGQESALPSFDDDTAVMAWFDAELPCLLAAQAAAEQYRWNTVVWQFGWVLHGYLWRRGRIHEQLLTWRAGLAAAQRLGDRSAQALAHRLFGQTATRAGLTEEANDHLRRALTLAREDGDLYAEARAHHDLTGLWSHDAKAALRHAGRALLLFKKLDNPVWEAEALSVAGWHQARTGDLVPARTTCEQALGMFSQNGNKQGQASTLTNLGFIAHQSGKHAQALMYYRDSLALHRELGARYGEADTLEHLGRLHAALGRKADAERAWRQALGLYVDQHRTVAAEGVRQQLAMVEAAVS